MLKRFVLAVVVLAAPVAARLDACQERPIENPKACSCIYDAGVQRYVCNSACPRGYKPK